MGTSAFFGELLLNAANHHITVDSNAGEMTSGTYYIYSPTAAESAVDILADTITSLATSATVTASVSADGYLTLSGTASFTVSDFEAYDAFGFASDALSGASSYTATKRLEPSWVPGYDPADSLSPTSRQGRIVSKVAQSQAADGTTYTSLLATNIKQKLVFMYISNAKTWNADDTRNSCEEFYETCCDGRQLLFIPTWTGSGSYSTVWEYVLDLTTMNEYKPKRTSKVSDTYWQVELDLLGVS